MGKLGVWILALGGGVLTVLYLLPWAYIALDLLGNCRDTPRVVQEPFVSFEEIVNQGTSDKRTHHYGAFYSLYLDPLRLQRQSHDSQQIISFRQQKQQQQQPGEPGEVKMLEIGLKHGDSLRLWKRAFPRGVIYSIDNGKISRV
ncbi:hypothetical protein CLOM_g16821 [Closterium sp. NIES-68]|nr:hypothetical protein CLOM_g16821 [Closterium sp. NIES-68]GJP75619.1 hypothetical protein CLOP_g6047 [Closterium sp. NIES-67]